MKQKTAKDPVRRSLKSINQWCRANRHQSVAFHHKMLVWKLRGHCAYYGIAGNATKLTDNVLFARRHIWQKWLNR